VRVSCRGKISLLVGLWLGLAGLLAASPGSALAAGGHPTLRTVSYHGYRISVPRSWPVYHLRARSSTCVRFNRHAVYLGQPGADQRCPVAATGRTEAILIQPSVHADTGLGGPGVGRLVQTRDDLTITATWRTDPAVIRTALHGVSLRRLAAGAARHTALRQPTAPGSALAPARLGTARRANTVSASAPATPGATFTGEGFDACATPSTATMSAWGASSPYGAIGVYIGGINMACAQPNLTASWVSGESAAGWHLAPIYVGEQAPTNSCSGCSSITPSQASAEGTAAATDAVYDAAGVGIGAGNPIYFDMEGYSRTTANSTAVLAFLEAWTEQLHTDGYTSGVYSSDASGIADLASQLGTSYVEPDDLWIAAWNNQANTADATIPTTAWADHQRLHQYMGANEETYGGVTIDVDNDDLDSATAAYGGGAAATPAPALPTASAAPTIDGVPVVGQTLAELHASWSGSPTGYAEQWYRCIPNSASCVAISGATGATYTLTSADAGHSLVVSEVAANASGLSTAADSTGTAAVASTAAGYWSFTATGAVDNSEYELLWGSPGDYGLKDFVGMAATPGRLGYWMVTRHATVYAFGNATVHPAIHVAHPVVGIVRDANVGYWLYTAKGNVYASTGAAFDGSPARYRGLNVTGMAATPNGQGYWLVTRTGMIFTFGKAKVHTSFRVKHPVKGIVAAPNQGFWLYTADGNIYPSSRAPFYGSPVRDKVTNIASMLATPDGHGYWLITRTGRIYAYGDAAKYPNPTLTSGAIVGLAG
jgi:hypothetical protein